MDAQEGQVTMLADSSVLPAADMLEMPKRRRRHPGMLTANILAVVVIVLVIIAAARSAGFKWHVVGQYLFAGNIALGALTSILLTVVTMALAIVLGFGVALVRMSSSRVWSSSAAVYIWLFRSVPMLVMLLFFYNLAALFPRLGLGVPFGPTFVSASTNTLVPPFAAVVIGLTLHETAFVAELVRSGLIGVQRGQREAADALGLNSRQAFMHIVLPQAMRIITPSLGNEVIALLKGTSLVSVVAITDLLYSVQLIYEANYETIPLLIVASLWYVVIVGILTLGQRQLEQRLGRRSLAKAAAQPAEGQR
jgi:polar amino acid transport system permease protein